MARLAMLVVLAAPAGDLAAQECSPWEWADPRPSPVHVGDVGAGPDRLLAVGEGRPLASLDGLTWAIEETAPEVSFYGLLWDGRRYVGVGDKIIATSPDGRSWTPRYVDDFPARGNDFVDVATNGDSDVAVGVDNWGFASLVATSRDGLAWTLQRLPGTGLGRVLWTGSEYLALGDGAFSSPDGLTWTRQAGIHGTGIAWNGRVFVAVGSSAIFHSEDGIAWTSVPPPRAGLADVAWGDGTFVAVGGDGLILTSPDGVTWADRSVAPEVSLVRVRFVRGQFVAVGNDVLTSLDGVSWRRWGSRASTALLEDAAGSGHDLVATGSGGEVLHSPDGVEWTRVVGPSASGTDEIRAVAWAGERYVAVGTHGPVLGSGGMILTSPDGVSWSSQESPLFLTGVASDGTRVLAVGPDGYALSAGGAAFETHSWPMPVPAGSAGTVGGGGRFLVTFGSSSVGVTTDGVVWNVVAPAEPSGAAIAWGGGTFVAAGHGVWVSQDGEHWTAGSGLADARDLVWAGARFLAVDGSSGGWKESVDGTTWVAAPVPPLPARFSYTGVVGTSDRLVAVGNDAWGSGAIVRSACGEPEPSRFVPGMAHQAGLASTAWRSDLELYNAGNDVATVAVDLLPRGEEVSEPVSVVRSVAPGVAVRFQDLLWTRFGFEGAATVRLRSWGGALRASARTYDATPAGTFGQYVPVFGPEDAIGEGGEARLLQLAQHSSMRYGFRTNLGLVNTTDAPLEVDVELRDFNGLVLARETVPLGALESIQLDRAFAGLITGDFQSAFAILRTPTPGGRFLAYASVVDNRSGDPVFVRPAARSEAGGVVWLPGAAHVAGEAGSVWRTDVDLHNAGETPVTCLLTLLPWGSGGAPPAPVSATVTVEPGHTVPLPDVVGRTFHAVGGATIRITPTGGELLASARTYDETPDGAFGQFVPGAPDQQAAGPPARLAMIQLSDAPDLGAGFRTNLGLVNASDTGITVVVELHAASGDLLGRITRDLSGRESLQLDRVFAVRGAGPTPDGYALAWTATPGGRLLAYASVIDNRTNDPTYVPAR